MSITEEHFLSLESKLEKAIREETLGVKASISQDLDRRFDAITDKMLLKIDTVIDNKIIRSNEEFKKDVRLFFIEESRKISGGLTTKITENDKLCSQRDEKQSAKIITVINEVDALKNAQILQKGFIAGITAVGSILVGAAIWVLNRLFN